MMMLLLIELVLITLTIPLWVPLICTAGENNDIEMDTAARRGEREGLHHAEAGGPFADLGPR